jgi:hypothetical protein
MASRYVMTIVQICLNDLKPVELCGKNDNYVRLSFGDGWTYVTSTEYDSGESAEWNMDGFIGNAEDGSTVLSGHDLGPQRCGILSNVCVETTKDAFESSTLNTDVWEYNSLRPHTRIGGVSFPLDAAHYHIGEEFVLGADVADLDGCKSGHVTVTIRLELHDASVCIDSSLSYLGKSRFSSPPPLRNEAKSILDISSGDKGTIDHYTRNRAIPWRTCNMLYGETIAHCIHVQEEKINLEKETQHIHHTYDLEILEDMELKLVSLQQQYKSIVDREAVIQSVRAKSSKIMDRFENCDRAGQFELDLSTLNLTGNPPSDNSDAIHHL